MNIRQLNTVLCLSAICLSSSTIAIAKEQGLKMTEKNIQECTSLLNKVAESDKKIHEDMGLLKTRAAQNSALLSANNPIKPFNLSSPTQALPKTVAPAPVAATPQNKPSLPANTQLFASDDPKAIDHLTGKTTTPLLATPDYAVPKTTSSTATKSLKPSSTKPRPHMATSKVAKSHPRIQLFAPNNESVDLNHIEGKSADIDELAKSKKNAANNEPKATPDKKVVEQSQKTDTTNTVLPQQTETAKPAEPVKKADDTKTVTENTQKAEVTTAQPQTTIPAESAKTENSQKSETTSSAPQQQTETAKPAEPEKKADNPQAMSDKSEKSTDTLIKSSI